MFLCGSLQWPRFDFPVRCVCSFSSLNSPGHLFGPLSLVLLLVICVFMHVCFCVLLYTNNTTNICFHLYTLWFGGLFKLQNCVPLHHVTHCSLTTHSCLLLFHSQYLLQGELVDRVEYHVTQSLDYVEQARGQLTIAQDYQSKARKVSLSDT